jgi:hypothetical protein
VTTTNPHTNRYPVGAVNAARTPDLRLRELTSKLITLVDNTDDRLTDEHTNAQYILERLLDRICELTYDVMPTDPTDPGKPTYVNGVPVCQTCGSRPATITVHAGNLSSDTFRCRYACMHCTQLTITWAAPAGAVHVQPYKDIYTPYREVTS